MKVLTIGATGKYAGLVVPELKKRGVTVRTLVRDESEIAAARERGANETAVGDLRDSASLLRAADGMGGVFTSTRLSRLMKPEWAWRWSIPPKNGSRRLLFLTVRPEGLTRMNAHYDKYGFAGSDSLVLQAVLGREPRSLRQYIYELAGNSSHSVST